MRFHVSDDGRVRECRASVGVCPLGAGFAHFADVGVAQGFADRVNFLECSGVYDGVRVSDFGLQSADAGGLLLSSDGVRGLLSADLLVLSRGCRVSELEAGLVLDDEGLAVAERELRALEGEREFVCSRDFFEQRFAEARALAGDVPECVFTGRVVSDFFVEPTEVTVFLRKRDFSGRLQDREDKGFDVGDGYVVFISLDCSGVDVPLRSIVMSNLRGFGLSCDGLDERVERFKEEFGRFEALSDEQVCAGKAEDARVGELARIDGELSVKRALVEGEKAKRAVLARERFLSGLVEDELALRSEVSARLGAGVLARGGVGDVFDEVSGGFWITG